MLGSVYYYNWNVEVHSSTEEYNLAFAPWIEYTTPKREEQTEEEEEEEEAEYASIWESLREFVEADENVES